MKLSGYKTYLASAAGLAATIAYALGKINAEQFQVLSVTLGFSGMMALRAGVGKR